MIDDIEIKLESAGLIDLSRICPDIVVELKYSSEDNFAGENMYGLLDHAYLTPDMADRVCAAQRVLSEQKPGYRIVVYDAARPISVQRRMYDMVKGTDCEEYVASPHGRGGFHNYGLAVDLSILSPDGASLDMGSGFDFFGIESHSKIEEYLVERGLITPQAAQNRRMLYDIMNNVGLYPHEKEWWHYQHFLKEEDKDMFVLLDF